MLSISIYVAAVSIITALVRAFLQSNLYTPVPSPIYDFVIVGGGTAGSLIAAELALSHPNHSVVLLESGPGVRNNPLSEQSVPGGAVHNIAFGNIDWGHTVEPQRTPLNTEDIPDGYTYNDRSYPIPRGKGLGGSNELNFMLHVRGTTKDYETWEAMTGGDPRWGPASMQSAEDEYQAAITFASKPNPHLLANDWVEAAGTSHYNKIQGSYNDPKVIREGGFHYEHAVRDGVRQSTARQFLLPRMGLRNLDVVVGANVEHILFHSQQEDSGVRAKGVALSLDACVVTSLSVPDLGTLIPNMRCLFGGRQSKDVGRRMEVIARKEVILSAGAYETPHLLLKSGIGPKDELHASGIDALVDLQGVGKNLQDHPIAPLKYRLGKEGGAWLPKSGGRLSLLIPSTITDYLLRGQGLLSSSGCEFGYFGASSPEYEGRPDLQVHGMVTAGDSNFFTELLKIPKKILEDTGVPSDFGLFGQGLAVGPTLLHPKARGEVRLRPSSLEQNATSANNKGYPIIDYELFHNEEDISRLIEGIRRTQSIMAQPAMAAHEPTLLHIRALSDRLGADTDEYWREYIKRIGFVVYHPVGTCKMGRIDDPASVVDPELRVIGVDGLRIADASVMPDITSGNTQVPTAAIAVQMVRILKEKYRPGDGAV